mmetsp:Transcript_10308/g.15004  ORF Transcript_10308/g.15004 Transcript_10308/m.15004 type:complete len:81 (-) Transcript_10308:1600-1842(-)
MQEKYLQALYEKAEEVLDRAISSSKLQHHEDARNDLKISTVPVSQKTVVWSLWRKHQITEHALCSATSNSRTSAMQRNEK